MSADDDLFSPIWAGIPSTRIDDVHMSQDTVKYITDRLNAMSFGDEIIFTHYHDGSAYRYYLTLKDRVVTY